MRLCGGEVILLEFLVWLKLSFIRLMKSLVTEVMDQGNLLGSSFWLVNNCFMSVWRAQVTKVCVWYSLSKLRVEISWKHGKTFSKVFTGGNWFVKARFSTTVSQLSKGKLCLRSQFQICPQTFSSFFLTTLFKYEDAGNSSLSGFSQWKSTFYR